jgi:hypothetical protein
MDASEEERFMRLEVKAAYLEKLALDLDEVVVCRRGSNASNGSCARVRTTSASPTRGPPTIERPVRRALARGRAPWTPPVPPPWSGLRDVLGAVAALVIRDTAGGALV